MSRAPDAEPPQRCAVVGGACIEPPPLALVTVRVDRGVASLGLNLSQVQRVPTHILRQFSCAGSQ